LGPDAVILINVSGRGDKDMDTAAAWFKLTREEGTDAAEVAEVAEVDGTTDSPVAPGAAASNGVSS
ncbi:MAG: hypothetical protein QOD96_2255, partial [Pseudonocardiales bacterium]|nr:hypothetical protein [Pseudonocardiales bacterium]